MIRWIEMRNWRNLIWVLLTLPTAIGAQTSIANPQADVLATVFIFRATVSGIMHKHEIFVGESYVGTLPNGKYIKLRLKSGHHLIWSNSDNYAFINANLESGQTYVVNAVLRSGKRRGNLLLTPLDTGEDCKKCIKFVTKKIRKLQKMIDRNKEVVLSDEEKLQKEKDLADNIKESLKIHELGKSKWEVVTIDIPSKIK